MAVHILQPRRPKIGRTVAYHYPAYGPGEAVLYWAEGGMIAFEDRRPSTPADKRCGMLDWREVSQHFLMTHQLMLSSSEDRRWGFERRRLAKFGEQLKLVIQEAMTQEAARGPHKKSQRQSDRRHGAIPVAFEADLHEMALASNRSLPAPTMPATKFDGLITPSGSTMDF